MADLGTFMINNMEYHNLTFFPCQGAQNSQVMNTFDLLFLLDPGLLAWSREVLAYVLSYPCPLHLKGPFMITE